MSKSKCGVKVISAEGVSWTTNRGARRLIEGGLADEVDLRTIRMVQSHRLYDAHPGDSRPHSPFLVVVDRSEQIAKGQYRNEVLGLPNFVGIQPARKNVGRKVA